MADRGRLSSTKVNVRVPTAYGPLVCCDLEMLVGKAGLERPAALGDFLS